MKNSVSFPTLNLTRMIIVIALVVFLAFSVSVPVYGLTPAQQKIFNYQIYEYDDEINTACSAANGNGTNNAGSVSTTASQEANAKIVIGVAKTENLGKEGALVGLIVAVTESTLSISANSNVPISLSLPHESVGSDHDSLGIMQQRISKDWSTISSDPNNRDAVAQLMNPAYSAEAFYGSPPGASAPRQLSKGLQNISGWQSLDPGVAAQKVQASDFTNASNYQAHLDMARSLLGKLWDSSPAIPLPVALNASSTAGSATGSVSNSSCSSVCNTVAAGTSASNVRQQVVCLAQAEYQQWQSGRLKPGTDFHKYSQGRDENWCADFVSWIYNQAQYPIDPGAKDGNVPAVATIESVGKLDKLFHYHAASGYTPKPGDVAIHYQGGSPSHVNIVTAVSGSSITLIGGNQSTNSFNTSNVSQYNVSGSTDDGITGYVSLD